MTAKLEIYFTAMRPLRVTNNHPKDKRLFWQGVWLVTKPLFLNLRQGAAGAADGLGACATARESHPPGL